MRQPILLPAAVLAALLLAVPARAADQPAGTVEDVTGSVTLTHGAAAPVPLAKGASVYMGDSISSDLKSRAVIKFADGSDLVVASKGILVIDKYVFDPAKPAEGGAHFRILGAAFSYVGGLLDKAAPPDVSINLDLGTIGIRGTKVYGLMKGNLDWVYLEEGGASFGNEGGKVDMKPGDGTTANARSEAPMAPHAWTEDEIAWIKRAVDKPDDMQVMAYNDINEKKVEMAGKAARDEGSLGAAAGGGAASGEAAPAAAAPATARARADSKVPAAPAASAEATNMPAAEPQAAHDILAWHDVSPDMIGTKFASDYGALRIDAQWPVDVNLAQADVAALGLQDTALKYSAMMKAKDLDGAAYLEMWVHFPGEKGGSYFSRGLDHQLTKDGDWELFQTPFFLKAGQVPDKVTMNVVVNGRGTVWVRDVKLQY